MLSVEDILVFRAMAEMTMLTESERRNLRENRWGIGRLVRAVGVLVGVGCRQRASLISSPVFGGNLAVSGIVSTM